MLSGAPIDWRRPCGVIHPTATIGRSRRRVRCNRPWGHEGDHMLTSRRDFRRRFTWSDEPQDSPKNAPGRAGAAPPGEKPEDA